MKVKKMYKISLTEKQISALNKSLWMSKFDASTDEFWNLLEEIQEKIDKVHPEVYTTIEG